MGLDKKRIDWKEDIKDLVKDTFFLLLLVPALSIVWVLIKIGDIKYRRNNK